MFRRGALVGDGGDNGVTVHAGVSDVLARGNAAINCISLIGTTTVSSNGVDSIPSR